MNLRRTVDDAGLGLFSAEAESPANRSILDEDAFHRVLSLERKRTARSHKPFLLMLLDMGDELSVDHGEINLLKILDVLSGATRETDVVGWHKHGVVVGAMFTELDAEERKTILNSMLSRMSGALQTNLTFEQFNQITISFHWFPEEWGSGVPKRPSDPALYPDLMDRHHDRRMFGAIKRAMDVAGSTVALILLSPLFLAVAIAIKLTSEGPVIFRQDRLGQFGKLFTCLKFRTMNSNNDLTLHREFMKRVIHGQHQGEISKTGEKVYAKMTEDPRITPVGRFLRRLSLDELPQFFNVLKGEMSLVGPRPPLAYEFQQYDIWHRRRVVEAKPGMTGLWQVNGRSRLRFDEMVRLDLRYVRTRSIWLDIQIILQTPRAVFMANDAF